MSLPEGFLILLDKGSSFFVIEAVVEFDGNIVGKPFWLSDQVKFLLSGPEEIMGGTCSWCEGCQWEQKEFWWGHFEGWSVNDWFTVWDKQGG